MGKAIRNMSYDETFTFLKETHERWHYGVIREEIKNNNILSVSDIEKLVTICNFIQDGYPDLIDTVI